MAKAKAKPKQEPKTEAEETKTEEAPQAEAPTQTTVQQLDPADLIEVQSRYQPDMIAIGEYAEEMRQGAKFPPLSVITDGESYWCWDGNQRKRAAQQAGKDTIECIVEPGTHRDALLRSFGANATHGLRRSQQDKRRVVQSMLEDKEWSQWSDNEIARRCAVSQPFVSKLRPLFDKSHRERTTRKYQGADGQTHTMDVSNIGKSKGEAEAPTGQQSLPPASVNLADKAQTEAPSAAPKVIAGPTTTPPPQAASAPPPEPKKPMVLKPIEVEKPPPDVLIFCRIMAPRDGEGTNDRRAMVSLAEDGGQPAITKSCLYPDIAATVEQVCREFFNKEEPQLIASAPAQLKMEAIAND